MIKLKILYQIVDMYLEMDLEYIIHLDTMIYSNDFATIYNVSKIYYINHQNISMIYIYYE